MAKTKIPVRKNTGSAPRPKGTGSLKKAKAERSGKNWYTIPAWCIGKVIKNFWEYVQGGREENEERQCSKRPAPGGLTDTFETWVKHFKQFDLLELKPDAVGRMKEVATIIADSSTPLDTKAEKIRDVYARAGNFGTLPGNLEGQEGPPTMDNLMEACLHFSNWDIPEDEEEQLRYLLSANVVYVGAADPSKDDEEDSH